VADLNRVPLLGTPIWKRVTVSGMFEVLRSDLTPLIVYFFSGPAGMVERDCQKPNAGGGSASAIYEERVKFLNIINGIPINANSSSPLHSNKPRDMLNGPRIVSTNNEPFSTGCQQVRCFTVTNPVLMQRFYVLPL
jgi:hypothetical protein